MVEKIIPKLSLKSFLFFLVVTFTFLVPIVQQPTLANSNFATYYDVTYTVREDGITHVNFDVILTNKTSDYYASSYSVTVGFKDIENVKASDPNGTLIPLVTKDGENVKIELTFNKKAVGINNQINFNLSFDTRNVAKKVGRVWEISILGLANQESFESFNVYVLTPSSFGKPSYVKPKAARSQENRLVFTKQQLGKSAIFIGFGDFQIYKFNLTYHLKNPNLYKIKTEIAFPPSTNYQDVEIEDITPKPLNVFADQDGNWLAVYQLAPSQKIDVVVKGKAKVAISPKKQAITKEKIATYLNEQKYWESSSAEIKTIANNLKTPRAIYEYVVNNLKYDFSRVVEGKDRLGARNVIRNPKSAICLEFTDLFIALARAAGIPAREVNGFTYTEGSKDRPLSLIKDVIHAWPEYYDFERQTWVMVDPTWGNTTKGLDYFHTLDFDRIAFVIKGVDSKYPIPAGAYKPKKEERLKDVNVSFGKNFEESSPDLLVEEVLSKDQIAGLPIERNIIIRNVGKTLSPTQTATVVSTTLTPSSQKIKIDPIPPYGFSTYKVRFASVPILTNRKDIVTIALGGNSISKSIRIYPIFRDKWFIVEGGIIFVAVCVVLSYLALNSGRIPFLGQEWRDSIRR